MICTTLLFIYLLFKVSFLWCEEIVSLLATLKLIMLSMFVLESVSQIHVSSWASVMMSVNDP